MIEDFSDEQLKDMAMKFARNDFPNTSKFNGFLNSLAPKNHAVVDFENGEIKEGMVFYHPKVQIATKAFWNEYERMKTAPAADERGSYFQMFMEYHSTIEDKLKHSDRTRLMKLAIAQYQNKKAFENNGNPMTAKEIATLWKVSEKKISDNYLTPYQRLGYLKKEKKGRSWYYTFNSKALLMGKVRGNDKFTKVFYSKLKDVEMRLEKIMQRQKKDYKYAPLGTLHFIIPFFHFETLYLTKNPTVSILEHDDNTNDALKRDNARVNRKLKYMSIAEIQRRISAAHSGEMKRDIVMKHLQWLQLAGALKIDEVYGRVRIILHPHLGGSLKLDDPYVQTILNQFEVHKKK